MPIYIIYTLEIINIYKHSMDTIFTFKYIIKFIKSASVWKPRQIIILRKMTWHLSKQFLIFFHSHPPPKIYIFIIQLFDKIYYYFFYFYLYIYTLITQAMFFCILTLSGFNLNIFPDLSIFFSNISQYYVLSYLIFSFNKNGLHIFM